MLKVFRKLFGKKINITQSQFNGGAKVCKDCGTSTNSSLPHCVNCGGSEFYNTYNDYLLTTYKYCARCGHDNTAGNKCCPYCGCSRFISYSSLAAKQHAEATKDDRKKKLKIAAIVLSMLLLIGLLIFAIYEHIVIEDTSWPGLLIMFLVYSIVTFAVMLIYKAVNNDEIIFIVFMIWNGFISGIGVFLSFLFIILPYSYEHPIWPIIWCFGISLTIFIGNIATFIAFLPFRDIRDSDNMGYYISSGVFVFLSLVFLIASIAVISTQFGWDIIF